jgi:hypothetical protein
METLKNAIRARMMTMVSTLLILVAWAQAEGVNILGIIGGYLDQAEGTGALIMGAVSAALVALQNYLNKD